MIPGETGDTQLTLIERLRIHRIVEAARAQIWDLDLIDAENPARELYESVGLDYLLSQAGRRLLDEELARLIARAEKEWGDAAYAMLHESTDEWNSDDQARPPVDPLGELAGRRVGTTCLLGRRTDNDIVDSSLEGEVYRPEEGKQG